MAVSRRYEPPFACPPSAARTKVLLAYVSYPATTARYLETSLRGHHDVVTVGPSIGPELIRAWNLKGLREPVRPHDLPCDADVDMERVMAALPRTWQPDLVLWVESVPGYRPRNISRLDCPTAAYLIDSRLRLPEHLDWAPRFDHVFVAQRAYVNAFRASGSRDVHWLPLGCDVAVHGKAAVPKRFDVGFVGSLTSEHRIDDVASIVWLSASACTWNARFSATWRGRSLLRASFSTMRSTAI